MTTPKHVADMAAAVLYQWPDLNAPEQSDNAILSQHIKASIGRLPQMRTEAGRKRVDAIRDYLTDQLFDIEEITAQHD